MVRNKMAQQTLDLTWIQNLTPNTRKSIGELWGQDNWSSVHKPLFFFSHCYVTLSQGYPKKEKFIVCVCVCIYIYIYIKQHIYICCCSVAKSHPTLSNPEARQASLSFTISQSLLKLMSIESVMPSNHLILCRPLSLLPSIFPSIMSSDTTEMT